MSAPKFTMKAHWSVDDANGKFVGIVHEMKYPAVKYTAVDPWGNSVDNGEFWDDDPSGSGYLESEDAARALVAHAADPRYMDRLLSVTWSDRTGEQHHVNDVEEVVTSKVTTLLEETECGTGTDLVVRDPLGQDITDDFIRGLSARGEKVYGCANPI